MPRVSLLFNLVVHTHIDSNWNIQPSDTVIGNHKPDEIQTNAIEAMDL